MAEESISLKESEIVKRPQRQISYIGQYPNMPEFEQPTSFALCHSERSEESPTNVGNRIREILRSLILSQDDNRESRVTLESALFHIDGIGLGERQTPVVREFITNFVDSLVDRLI